MSFVVSLALLLTCFTIAPMLTKRFQRLHRGAAFQSTS
jgi:hypothetical protein